VDRRQRLEQARLYLCTPDRPDLAEFLEQVLAGGVDIVQLREKGVEARRELELLAIVGEVAARHGALWSVNDRADVAHVAGADVLHLGQDDLPVAAARRIISPYMLVGRSTHDEAQVDAAAVEEGVDYFCVGPTWPTPTKPGRPAPGLALTRHAAATSGRPWFAIGGIDLGNLQQVLDAGATRVVVVRALTEAADPRTAAEAFKARL
jgi:thiamine-phosphate pyrophosphorylase